MRTIAVCSALVAWLAFTAPLVYAQELPAHHIGHVRVRGLERISEQLVRSQFKVQPGDIYTPGVVAGDIRRLYELGHFITVKVDGTIVDGKIELTYIFEEKPGIQALEIVGNDKVRTRYIRGLLSWREGDSFDADAYGEEREAILKLYKSKGFHNATVDIHVDEVAPSHVRITYLVDEGRKARIRRIQFVGNAALSNRKLRKLIKTKRKRWFLGGKYDEDQFDADLESILDEYGDYGHLEAEVVDTQFDYRKGGKGLEITATLDEGAEYRVETLEATGNLVFKDEEIFPILRVQPGDVHNKSLVEEDAVLIERGYVDSGYDKGRVTPQVTLDRDNKTTHIVHRVYEGDLKYIREITITGTTTTRDDVIRREILLLPGDRFDGTLLRASERRLDNTRFFEKVRFTLEDVEEDDRFADLLVDIEEDETGEFGFGGGYSTEEKLGGFLELSLNNFDIANWPTFAGGGQQFRARLFLGGRRNQVSISFTDPEIGGYPLSFGFDLFDESHRYSGGTDFTEESQGLRLRFGKSLSPFLWGRVALRYEDIDISDTPTTTNPEIRPLWEVGSTISNIWGLTRNTVDSTRDATTGSRHDLQFEVAGLGGDNHFYKLTHDSTWYWPLDKNKKYVLSFRTREGWADDYGSSDIVPISDRFFAGGASTVRGYDTRDIGPKERRFFCFGDTIAIGGELRLINNLELKYKLSDQLRLFAFLDSGGVWKEAGDFSLGDIKYAGGVGFGVEVPRLGPIRIDYGIPINPDRDQGNGRLHLQTGFRF